MKQLITFYILRNFKHCFQGHFLCFAIPRVQKTLQNIHHPNRSQTFCCIKDLYLFYLPTYKQEHSKLGLYTQIPKIVTIFIFHHLNFLFGLSYLSFLYLPSLCSPVYVSHPPITLNQIQCSHKFIPWTYQDNREC